MRVAHIESMITRRIVAHSSPKFDRELYHPLSDTLNHSTRIHINTSARIARNFELHQTNSAARRAGATSIRMSRVFADRKRGPQARETSTLAAFAFLRELSERATSSSPSE